MADEKKLPAVKFRIGSVTATVWMNDNFYSVVLSKSYKDEHDKWHDTDSLSHVDVLCAMKALERAEKWISEH